MRPVVAFIPARGSKGIPRKNLRLLAGRPLVYWALDAACGSAMVDQVVLSTEDEEIRNTVAAYTHPKVRIVNRSPETAADTASTESAMLEFARRESFVTMVLVQATSPLLTSSDLDVALAEYAKNGFDSLLSVVHQTRFWWAKQEDSSVRPVNYDPAQRPRRQDFSGQLVENGAFYICSRLGLLRHERRLFGRIGAHVMSEEAYLELDSPQDWRIVEQLLLERQRAQPAVSAGQD